jgi:hypothetical protein
MAAYTFRYMDGDDRMIRLAMVQCPSDDDALLQACTTMSEPFCQLEIMLDDVRIYR